MHRKAFLAALAAAACCLVTAAHAQSFPSRPVTLVSPFPAGSGSDLTARAVTPGLAEVLGQPVVVENRPGAGGAIGAQYVAKAKPDGYTLFLASLSFSVLPSLMELNFDPAKDFEAVILMGQQGMAFVVPTSLPVNSMAELAALAKSQPGKLNYASAGSGSIGHLAGELFKNERSLNIVHVPFKGTPEALTAIMMGEVQMGLIAMPAAEAQIKAGKVKALAVTGTKRYAGLPEVPTLAESGLPSLSDSVWYVVLAPAGTPKDVIDKLNAAFRQAIAKPATVERMEGPAKTAPSVSTPQEATAYVRAQIVKWNGVAAQAGLKPQANK
ncbi:Bug family tripartite tricarboxylate transporter substrate binding protein [Caenimonas aquaedulcis]|uniref:Tripartite tricarboxylate transporter substrate binding protein n=1 Tax=Caenimonas aquaedulcis TaxID=2793270 RepID=A0A931MDU1_9BURK|nr:tripartite tricarboxylate transporter substrate binding protein [Caenimonas aquaedulcis]MBG9386417.1 tripartite tricarboxylate transporter substrate binding protein [Caenimonas aquaedulcis]